MIRLIVLHPIDSLISSSFPSFLHPEIVQHVLHFFLHSVAPHSASPIETHPISTTSFPRFPFFIPSPRTISLFNGTQSVPLLQVSVSTVSPFHTQNSPRPSGKWQVVRSLQRRPSSTRDVVKVEEPNAQPCAESPESPFLSPASFGSGETALWSRLLARSDDPLEKSQLLLSLAALIRWESKQKPVTPAVLERFLREEEKTIEKEVEDLAGNEESAPLLIRVALDSLESVWNSTNSKSKEARREWLESLLESRFSALRSLLDSVQSTSSAIRMPLTRVLMFLRASAPILFDSPPSARQLAFVPSLFTPAEIFWRKVITDAAILRAKSDVLNSAEIEDREKLGIYRIPSNNSAEFAPIFENALFSRFYVGFSVWFHDRPRFICSIAADCAVPRQASHSRGASASWTGCGRFRCCRRFHWMNEFG